MEDIKTHFEHKFKISTADILSDGCDKIIKTICQKHDLIFEKTNSRQDAAMVKVE